ncbi:c-type cytochrome [Rubripirellula sp.]|jgi:putative heme-binding domain-containing protein|nr:c-type cytochrome [Rubripirellula sp.]
MFYNTVKPIIILTALLGNIAVHADEDLRARNDAIIVRAVERMNGYDIKNDEHVMNAMMRHMQRMAGTEEFLELARKYRPQGIEKQLQDLVLNGPSDNSKAEAASLLLDTADGQVRLSNLVQSKDINSASTATRVLGNLGSERSRILLSNLVKNTEIEFEVRKQAVIGLSKNGTGQNAILQLVTNHELPADMRLLAGGLLTRSDNATIRERAQRLLPQPQQKNAAPLAPIDQLAGMKGTIESGKKLFEGIATCSNCHIVNRNGKEVGPDLSEIGSKLSREAMYTAILDPSAGISHNYENYSVLTLDGQVINGLKISETNEEVVVRTADAIDRRVAKTDVELIKKSDKSIMPENLHHTFDQQGLIDIVEYMSSLTKR